MTDLSSQPQINPDDISTVPETGKSLDSCNSPVLERHHGEFFAWFETGTEGLIWAMQEDGKEGYDGLLPIEPGDYLIIQNPDGTVLFAGTAEPDYRLGWKEHYPGADHGQPAALGYWIHWTQKGWEPDKWAALFLEGDINGKPNRGVVARPAASDA